jgi:hypothetical protein
MSNPGAQKPLFLGGHGNSWLPHIDVLSYNIELKDDGGFLGDRASKKALAAILDDARKPLLKDGRDPFGERPSGEIGKQELDDALKHGDTEVAGLIHTVVEEFSQALSSVVKKMLK